eukprot:1257530-Prymnesium_polylepis.1
MVRREAVSSATRALRCPVVHEIHTCGWYVLSEKTPNVVSALAGWYTGLACVAYAYGAPYKGGTRTLCGPA